MMALGTHCRAPMSLPDTDPGGPCEASTRCCTNLSASGREHTWACPTAAPIRDPGREIAPDLFGRTAIIGPAQPVKRRPTNVCGAPASARRLRLS